MKKISIILVLALFALIPFKVSKAFEVKVDNSVHLAKEEIADGNVYASCADMTIDGTVNGDVVAVCKSIVVNGTVNGDLIAFSRDITINGNIKGSARIAGSNLNVTGLVEHNINAFGTNINLNPNSRVNWDVFVAGVNGMFNGNIDGNLHGYMTSASIAGKIGKNVNLDINDRDVAQGQGGLLITKDAVIGGGLTYSSRQEARIETPSSIVGSVSREINNKPSNQPMNRVFKSFYELSALVLIGLVLISLKKKVADDVAEKMNNDWWQSILIGLGILVITPLIILFLGLIIIGIPLAMITLAIYISAIFLAIIFSSYFIGDLLLKRLSKKPVNHFVILLLGLLIFAILSSLPFLGWLVSFVAVIYGLGGIFLTIKKTKND